MVSDLLGMEADDGRIMLLIVNYELTEEYVDELMAAADEDEDDRKTHYMMPWSILPVISQVPAGRPADILASMCLYLLVDLIATHSVVT